MTYIKTLLTINTILLLFIVLATGYAWLRVQGAVSAFSALGSSNYAATESLSQDGGSGASDGSGRAPITIQVSDLSDSQQQMLRSLGFTASSYTITAEMRTCAESKIGAARLDQIADGASPTSIEAVALIPCVQ